MACLGLLSDQKERIVHVMVADVLTPLCRVLSGDGMEEKVLLLPPDAKATFHRSLPSELVSGHQVGAPFIKVHHIRLG